MADARARRRRRILGAVTGLCAGLVVVGMIALLTQIATLTNQVRDQQNGNTDTIELIKSCTTKGGDCYEDGEKRTGNVIEVLNEFTTYAIACADRPGTQSAARIRACAIEALRKGNR